MCDCPLTICSVLYGHDLLGFLFDLFVDIGNELVCHLLQLSLQILDLILGNLCSLQLLESIVAVTTDPLPALFCAPR